MNWRLTLKGKSDCTSWNLVSYKRKESKHAMNIIINENNTGVKDFKVPTEIKELTTNYCHLKLGLWFNFSILPIQASRSAI